ncbi:MAG: DNA polymerase domain-containing protein [Armatimonadota bacterium]|nr:DNA polymerase domain-containing protein [Armatimonadota bacterium]MDR7451924.1 DNA polymerase domain-containing protein [Armatimonadota bacterium]MDR7466606.1 DNA polymerase domain-containing protein [Armatimonadota bacterium]MDR7492920.1 DNA polymerase domain-containing protein [Armatimonadota bacterium]MDR7500317.1 DNA polymerase domain-containing protein [Armatimonadota bacterium]
MGGIEGRALEGWLFDVYPAAEGMVVWVLDRDGRPHRLIVRYQPGMFFAGPLRAVEQVERALRPLNAPVTIRPAVQRELMSGEEVAVFRLSVGNPLLFPAAARRLARLPGLTLYNCDIPVSRLFFYESRLFPLARCRFEVEDGVARAVEPLSHPEDLEYDLPPLLTLRLRLVSPLRGDALASPAHGRWGLLEAGVDGETVVVDGDDPADCIRSLNRLLARYDPDVILTEWGDAVLLPRLRALAARSGLPLYLNREPHGAVRTRRPRSYLTYGQVVYQAGAQMLYGRWHIDLQNSFIYSEGELAGLLEVARLSGIPVQDQARTSTGTAISSMQIQQAVRDGVLIPWQKSEPEAFKTGSQLLLTDKGGLTYQPLVGLYEQVGELDFSSMYPTLMATFNLSPETIGCRCCPDSRVPEIGYSVCRRRRGLVPRVLDHLLERRMYYKRRRNESRGAQRALYHQRQTALKWCLVTSFGYLGYRNARFGRIEAHEAVTAFAREKLLQAKEVAERRGYRLLHALVDSLWLHRPGATREDYDALAGEVTQATGLPIFVEGVYRWLGFLPSKTHAGVGVPNRYLGVFEDGTTKVRGIEVRRSDVPLIAAETQARMLERMFACRDLAALRAALPEVLEILAEALLRLRTGEVAPEELVVTTRLSREVADYRHHTVQAVTARSLSRHGARLHPGEAIQYIITDRRAKAPEDRVRPCTLLGDDWSYDADDYARMVVRAAGTVLDLLGYGEDRLWREMWTRRSPEGP